MESKYNRLVSYRRLLVFHLLHKIFSLSIAFHFFLSPNYYLFIYCSSASLVFGYLQQK